MKPKPTEGTVQDKKEGLALLTVLMDENSRKVIIHAFETRLAQYLYEMLNPQLGDGEALAMRFKAMGVIEALTEMGVKMNRLAEYVPMRRATNAAVRDALGAELTG